VTLAVGEPLRVDCVGPDGVPAADVVCEFLPGDGALALQRDETDSTGRAHFAHCVPGTLRISDLRWLNDERPVAAGTGSARIALRAGLEVRGRAVLADGTPVARAAVTLRDPAGQLRPAERTVATDRDGTFRLGGLPEGREFVLFASVERDGRTFSHKRAVVAADGAPLTITLVCEDPSLSPTDR
jgi:hypothetical protein